MVNPLSTLPLEEKPMTGSEMVNGVWYSVTPHSPSLSTKPVYPCHMRSSTGRYATREHYKYTCSAGPRVVLNQIYVGLVEGQLQKYNFPKSYRIGIKMFIFKSNLWSRESFLINQVVFIKNKKIIGPYLTGPQGQKWLWNFCPKCRLKKRPVKLKARRKLW